MNSITVFEQAVASAAIRDNVLRGHGAICLAAKEISRRVSATLRPLVPALDTKGTE